MKKEIQIKAIRIHLEKYKLDWDLLDLESEVDSTLTLDENWNYIKEKYQLTTIEEIMEKIIKC